MHQNDLKQLEEQNAGLQILNRIKERSIKGPKMTLAAIEVKLNEMVTPIRQKQFSIDNVGYNSMVETEAKRLSEISLANKCLLQTECQSIQKTYSAPTSLVNEDFSRLSSSVMSIDIRLGDLATQSVDIVVVCSTSIHLLKDILDKAGPTIRDEVNKAFEDKNIQNKGYITSGGQLFCQQLLFLPWTTEKLNDEDLRQSIHTFFTTAIEYARNDQQTSIAFPALGCGQLKYDPKLIAEIILDETQRCANYNLKILIVLLESKQAEYKAFCLKLAEMRQRKSATNPANFHYSHLGKFEVALNHMIYLFAFFVLFSHKSNTYRIRKKHRNLLASNTTAH